MNFIKVRILKNGKPIGRAYTYKTDLELQSSDLVVLDGGKHGIVVDEPIDTEWIKTYGTGNIKEIKGIVKEDEDGGGK